MSNITKIGTLSDSDIKALCAQGKLIVNNFNAANIVQACYELRASSTYYIPLETDLTQTVEAGGYILIKPKQLVVVITLEELDLPNDILGRILTKGQLFSIGLQPVNTYADPGFKGNLGITLYNLSNNYLKIYPNKNIAKIEFSRLEKDVDKPYSGQHGYKTKIWPIPKDFILSQEEIKKDPRIKSNIEEIMFSYGPNIGKPIKKVFKYGRALVLATLGSFTVALLLLFFGIKTGNIKVFDPLCAIGLGIASNVLTSLLIFFVTDIKIHD